MCMAVSPKNACGNCGTLFEMSANSPLAVGFATPRTDMNPGSVSPSPISFDHSIPCNTMNAVPNAMVASSQLRVHERSARCAAKTAITIVSELDSKHAVMTVAFAMLSAWNGVGQGFV